MARNPSFSYSNILKSSSLIGGAEAIGLALGMVRVKFAAVLIGPLGVGLVGTYQAIQVMVGAVAGLGIRSSAVRDIAEAVGKGDDIAVGRTIHALRRICWLTGTLGAFAMVALSVPLSRYTFDTSEHALAIASLGAVILFQNIQGGQMALIQGMRRIGDLARINIIGAAAGTLITAILYAWLGMKGIIPALVLISLVQLVASWYFSSRIPVPKSQMSWRTSLRVSGSMVRLGLVFMWNGLLLAAVAFLTRALITQEISLEAVGIFTAAFSLSGMLVNFVLKAMGADYYPRLTSLSDDREAMNRLVNEQTEIGLLLAVPGLLATLTLSPWIIQLFYSGEFLPAADLLHWFILGCLGRIITWPMSFVMLALGKGLWFATTETLFNVLHLALIWGGLLTFGIEGVAVAFFALNMIYMAAIFAVARRLIGFSWSKATKQMFLMLLPIVMLAFLSSRFLMLWPGTVMGLVLTASTSVFCLRGLVQRIGHKHRVTRMTLQIPGVRWICRI